MKRFLLTLALCFASTFFAQNAAFRFASLTSAEIENIKDRPDFDFNAEELRNLPVADLLNIYVEEYLDVEKVSGQGKMTTLLALEIDEKGLLSKVTASGPNTSFNNEAVKVFRKFEGKEMNISQLKDADVEVLIPITIEI